MGARVAVRLGLILVVLVLAWRMLTTTRQPPPRPPAAPARGTLVVRLAAPAGAPADSARVLLRGAGVTYSPVAGPAATPGWPAFEQLPAGDYTLEVRVPGAAPRERPVRVRAGGTDTVAIGGR